MTVQSLLPPAGQTMTQHELKSTVWLKVSLFFNIQFFNIQ